MTRQNQICQSEALITTKIPVENLTEKSSFKAHHNLKKQTLLTYEFQNETLLMDLTLVHNLRVLAYNFKPHSPQDVKTLEKV